MFFPNHHHHYSFVINYLVRKFHLLQNPIIIPNHFTKLKIHSSQICHKFIPDKSRLPVLNEKDLEEQFVQGSGPGGQNVNRLQNCVVLKHIPTGIIVKCHQERLLQRNRKLARQLLLERLDVHFNGTDSIVEQKKRYILTRLEDREQRFSQLRMKKQQYQKTYQQSRQQKSEHNTE
ncbi:peptide chain release factor, mitochondrial-like protein [Euroglyphus maynei]|uniref:Peptide chain release factor, mitochondrial-like protein n=1 Tax=Euroglyphus maynei TaxID=6958 RepID=A0A1Y3ASI5_EURMA|nr:peptide chain release factor, mitochondrial-like protein [Euroglyphus maynei]